MERNVLEEGMSCLEAILRLGANGDVEDDLGLTPLCLASEKNNLSAIKILVSSGCHVNYTLKKGKFEGGSVLHFAAANAHVDTVQLLIDLGGDVNKKDWRGRTPLHWSAREGTAAVMKLIIQFSKDLLAEKDNAGLTLLHLAASGGNTETAECLLNMNFDVEARESTGWTPLHNAADNGNVSMIHLLLNYKANVNAVTWQRSTPLHFAALRGQMDAVKALIIRGADINVKDHNTWTPLCLSESRHHTDITDLLRSVGGHSGGASSNLLLGPTVFI